MFDCPLASRRICSDSVTIEVNRNQIKKFDVKHLKTSQQRKTNSLVKIQENLKGNVSKFKQLSSTISKFGALLRAVEKISH